MRAAPAHSRSIERPVMSLASLSPEAQLLLLTAGGERNDRAIRALLAGPLDWAKLTWLSEQERALLELQLTAALDEVEAERALLNAEFARQP